MTAAVGMPHWTQDQRAALADLHRPRPAHNLIAFAFVGMWALAAFAGHRFPVWPVRLAGYFTIGVAIHGLAVLMHEASHGNLARKPAADRWLGFLCGAPALLSCSAYRVAHLLHHRYLRGARDPEEFTNIGRRRGAQSAAFWAWAVIGGFSYLVFIPVIGLTRGRWRDRRRIAIEYGLIVLFYATLFRCAARYGFLPDVVHSLALPWLVTNALTNVRGWAEHAMTPRDGPLTMTRVVTSNRLVSLLMCNANYHLEHHLDPAIPWYNLPKLNAMLRDEYRAAGTSVYTSYLAFLRDAVRAGVHGYAPATRHMGAS